MPLLVQADQMLKEMNSAQHTDYDADALPLLLLQVLLVCLLQFSQVFEMCTVAVDCLPYMSQTPDQQNCAVSEMEVGSHELVMMMCLNLSRRRHFNSCLPGILVCSVPA